MAYSKTNWVNENEPAINADNLNKIEAGIEDNSLQLESYGRTINEIIDNKVETNAIKNEASTEVDEVYSSNYLNDKLVSVGSTAPTGGERVWFAKSKNLLPNNLTSQTINGLTIVVGDDQSITINGTTNATTNIDLSSVFSLTSGSYIISTNKQGTLNNSAYFLIINTSTSAEISSLNVASTSEKTFTLSATTNVKARLYASTDRTFTNFKIYPMLNEGSTAASYEPYVEEGIYVDEEKMLFDNYSTSEQVIGKWIDGKPLYRKVIVFTPAGNIPANTWTTIFNYTFTNLKQLIKSTVLNTDSTNTGELNWLTVQYFANDNAFKGLNTRNMTVTLPTNSLIIVEYTKTTD